jgi:hypothetical protein
MCSTASHTQPRFPAHPNVRYAELPRSPQPSSLLEVMDEDNYVPNSEFIEEVIGLDPEMVKMFSDLHWLSYLVALHDKGTLVMPSSTLNHSISECENFVDTVMRAGRYSDRTVKGVSSESGCCVIAGYIYVYLFLRRIPSSSRIFSYMLALMKQEWKRAGAFIREIFPPGLLLWVLFVGRCASSEQLESWFKEELVLSKDVLNLESWMEARGVLEQFAWVGRREETYEAFWDELVEFEATQNG